MTKMTMRTIQGISAAWVLTGAGVALADDPGVVRVEVLKLRSTKGKVGCTIFQGEDGFPSKPKKALQRTMVSITGDRAECVFTGIPAGEYAVSVMHDEDEDGELDTNFFGVPTEGWAVSNDAPPRTMRPPAYEKARFQANGSEKRLQVTLRY